MPSFAFSLTVLARLPSASGVRASRRAVRARASAVRISARRASSAWSAICRPCARRSARSVSAASCRRLKRSWDSAARAWAVGRASGLTDISILSVRATVMPRPLFGEPGASPAPVRPALNPLTDRGNFSPLEHHRAPAQRKMPPGRQVLPTLPAATSLESPDRDRYRHGRRARRGPGPLAPSRRPARAPSRP